MAKYLYDEMAWPEVKEAVVEGRVAIVPTGSCEQHSPVLPTKTDAFLSFEICKRAAERIPTEAVVLPVVAYGYNEHHFDFPGTIHIGHETFTNFVLDICKSLAHHGFRKLVIVNGHGSNTALVEFAARRATLETEAICASCNYFNFGLEAMEKIGFAEWGHAADMEISLMLYLAPHLVDMSKATRDVWTEGMISKSKHVTMGLHGKAAEYAQKHGNVQFMDWWGRTSRTGAMGEQRKATREKGEKLVEAILENMVDFIIEWKAREIRPRKDHH